MTLGWLYHLDEVERLRGLQESARMLDAAYLTNAALCDTERLASRARAFEAALRRDPHVAPEPPLAREDALAAAHQLFASLYPDRAAPVPPA